jgi:HNH endonuclease
MRTPQGGEVMKRKAITERMKIMAVLARFNLPCWLCHNRIGPFDKVEWDHMVPLGLGGEHYFRNLAPVHKTCHDKKTRGTKATTAGSDIGKISKERRIIRECKFVVKKRKPGARKPKSSWPSRKMQSKPFQKREKNAA